MYAAKPLVPIWILVSGCVYSQELTSYISRFIELVLLIQKSGMSNVELEKILARSRQLNSGIRLSVNQVLIKLKNRLQFWAK